MARRKCSKTKEELEKEVKYKARAKHKALCAKWGASAAKAPNLMVKLLISSSPQKQHVKEVVVLQPQPVNLKETMPSLQ